MENQKYDELLSAVVNGFNNTQTQMEDKFDEAREDRADLRRRLDGLQN